MKASKEILRKIPGGFYCYKNLKGDEIKVCPFWSLKEDLPWMEQGYCSILKKSDWDINEKRGPLTWKNKQGEVVQVTEPHVVGVSCLWDQVKDPKCPKYPKNKNV